MLIDFRKLFPKYGIQPKGVLHVGANVGEEAPVYDQLGIKNVVWIEPNPEIFEKLVVKTAEYNHRCYNVAAGDEDKDMILHVSNNGGQSSSILELGTHKVTHPDVYFTDDITVPMVRIDSFFSRIKENLSWSVIEESDFLNMDIQGAELKALKGMGELLKQFKWAYLEVNKEELYKGCALVEDIDLYMLSFGFRRVETYWVGNTGWGDALYIKEK